MGVTTQIQYKTSDGRYFADQKEAEKVQSIINQESLIPFRTDVVNSWINKLYKDLEISDELKALLNNKSTDGATIQKIVCNAIVSNLLDFEKLVNSIHGDESGAPEKE